MISLENNDVKVILSSKGAELISLVEKKDATEYIWQADPSIWAYHAPNLFPIVGGLKDNQLQVSGKRYSLNRHGFARTSTFRKLEAAPNHAHFELRYNEETLKVYPFKFEFQVIYHLDGRTLKVMYKVINMDEKTIYFSVGAHPAFNVPLKDVETFEDYYLEFQYPEELKSHQLSENGLFNGNLVDVSLNHQKLHLNKSLFDKDALVFKNLKSREVILKSDKGAKQVKVNFTHFNYLGLWSKADAPFVCIEPWLGCADSEETHKDISQKEAILELKHGHVFETDFSISI